MITNIAQKNRQFSRQIRNSEKQEYFKKVRMSLMSQRGSSQASPVTYTKHGQQQILESIYAHKKNGQLLDFNKINQYILGFQGQLSKEFRFQAGKVILESYRANGHAIGCLAHILTRCEENTWLSNIEDLREKAELLIKDNINKETERLINGRGLAFLYFGLINSVEDRNMFDFLPKYYFLFSHQGFYDQTFLLMLESASHFRQLLPKEQFVKVLLSQEIQYNKVDPVTLLILCQFMENYVCFDLSETVFLLLSAWVHKRLTQRKFSMKLKQNIIKIISICLSYQCVKQVVNQQQNSKLFQEISNIARLGSPSVKEEALSCLTNWVKIGSQQKVEFWVQYYQLLQILIYSLEINLDNQLMFKVMQTLIILLRSNKRHRKTSIRLGLHNQATRLLNSEYQKISEAGCILCQICNDI